MRNCLEFSLIEVPALRFHTNQSSVPKDTTSRRRSARVGSFVAPSNAIRASGRRQRRQRRRPRAQPLLLRPQKPLQLRRSSQSPPRLRLFCCNREIVYLVALLEIVYIFGGSVVFLVGPQKFLLYFWRVNCIFGWSKISCCILGGSTVLLYFWRVAQPSPVASAVSLGVIVFVAAADRETL